MADRDESDLIVVGSHGHSLLGGRLILGSVSQRVLYDARCSVRVARCWEEKRKGPVRIVVGFNGSQDSEVAVDAVASREWPEGSEARLITVLPLLSSEARDVAAEKLRKAGLTTSEISKDGGPAHVLRGRRKSGAPIPSSSARGMYTAFNTYCTVASHRQSLRKRDAPLKYRAQ